MINGSMICEGKMILHFICLTVHRYMREKISQFLSKCKGVEKPMITVGYCNISQKKIERS